MAYPDIPTIPQRHPAQQDMAATDLTPGNAWPCHKRPMVLCWAWNAGPEAVRSLFYN